MELLLWCCFVSFKKDSIFGGVCEMWINLNVGLMKEKGWKIRLIFCGCRGDGFFCGMERSSSER